MNLDFVLFAVSIIQAALALSQPAKKWMVLHAFVPDGLYDRDLAITRGTDILCDIPATSSPHNTTCKDNLVYLQSNNYLTLITEVMDKMYYVECNGVTTPLHLQYNETFDSQEEAWNFSYPVVKQNRSNTILRAAEDSPDPNLYWLLILIPVGLTLVLAIYLIYRMRERSQSGTYYCRKTQQDPNDGQWESVNSEDSEDTAQTTSTTQNGTNGTLGDGV